MNENNYPFKGLLVITVVLLFIFTFETVSSKRSIKRLQDRLELATAQKLHAELKMKKEFLRTVELEKEYNNTISKLNSLPLHPFIDKEIIISSSFGVNRGTHIHMGSDVIVSEGTPIYAVCDGYITTGRHKAAGNIARLISADSSFLYKFFHLESQVFEDSIKAGQIIGFSGNTGRSSNPHIHFEMLVLDGSSFVHINPETYLFPLLNRIREEDFKLLTYER